MRETTLRPGKRVTGADSGIGRAVAALFAREGADVAILCLNEHDDAAETKRIVEAEGRQALTIAGDIGDKAFCEAAPTFLFLACGDASSMSGQVLHPDGGTIVNG